MRMLSKTITKRLGQKAYNAAGFRLRAVYPLIQRVLTDSFPAFKEDLLSSIRDEGLRDEIRSSQ